MQIRHMSKVHKSDFFHFELFSFGAVDHQHYIVFFNYLIALDYDLGAL